MTSCYWSQSKDWGWSAGVPCGSTNKTHPTIPCCVGGDLCMTDGICRYIDHTLIGGSTYYAAGCTSKNTASSGCYHRCWSEIYPDIVYDNDMDSWTCCGTDSNGTRTCSDPVDDPFVADTPDNLIVYWTAGVGPATAASSSTSTSTTTSSSATSTSSLTTTFASSSTLSATAQSATSTAISNTSSDEGMSNGTKIGIGVGVGVGALALIIAASGILYRRRRRQKGARKSVSELPSGEASELPPGYPYPTELSPQLGHQKTAELSTSPRYELS